MDQWRKLLSTRLPCPSALRVLCVFLARIALLVWLLLWSAGRIEAGHVCTSWRNVNLNILIDYSVSMEGWKHELARAFALQVIDELTARGALSRAGGIGFPTAIPPGFNIVVNEENRSILRERIAAAGPPVGRTTPLYDAIVIGAGHNATLAGTARNLLVVITDGADVGSSWIYEDAANALRTSASWNFLVFAGEEMSASGATTLLNLSRDSGSTFQLAEAGTASTLAALVVREACLNHAPHAALNILPNPLNLGQPGFDIVFDATSSSDSDGDSLHYSWTLTQPDGASLPPAGGDANRLVHTFTDDQLPGTDWSVRLEVTDYEGGVDVVSRTFQVNGSPPIIALEGGGTIDALQPLSVRTRRIDDIDGGLLTNFDWEILGGPAGGTHAVGHLWTGTPEVSWTTTDDDITLFSDGTRLTDPWRFQLNVRDDENSVAAAETAVNVRNLPPVAEIEGDHAEIDVGDELSLRSVHETDPDGGDLVYSWDIVQAPRSALGVPALGWRSDQSWSRLTTIDDAGTWIIRLAVTDNEGEPDEDEVEILVDAPPEAHIAGPERVRSLTEELRLSSRASVDPDSACPDDPDTCHENLEGPERVSPAIVRRHWSLVDVPVEWFADFPLGGVDDALEVPAGNEELVLPPGRLRPGAWTFQLEVEDGEGNIDYDLHRVEVIEERSNPIAIVSPPRRYFLNAFGRTDVDIAASGELSFDPDNLLGGLGADRGIREFRWEVLGPPGCGAIFPTDRSTPQLRLFAVGDTVPAACLGYYEIGLTVRDDDTPTQEGSARTQLLLGTCPGAVCIDYPTTAIPQSVEFAEDTDVLIFYHLDSAIYRDVRFAFGLIARLDIYHADNLTEPVFTSFDSNVQTTVLGVSLVFHWNGYWFAERPRPGHYSVRISLLDYALSPTSLETFESNAIEIAVDEMAITTDSDHFVARSALESGSDTLSVGYEIDDTIPPDLVEWRLVDASGSTLWTARLSPNLSGRLEWDGRIRSSLIDTGIYTVELEAFRGGSSLTGVQRQTVTVYDLAVETVSGARNLTAMVNNDDDNLNGTDDADEAGATAGENDLVEARIIVEPAMQGTLQLLATDSSVRIRLYRNADRSGGATPLPLTYSIPGDPIPDRILIEGIASGAADLRLRFDPIEHPVLPDAIQPVRVVGIALEGAAVTGGRLRNRNANIARWDNAYGPAMGFAVRNMASDHFAERDPSRFYVRLTDPPVNSSAASIERAQILISTVRGDGAVDDDPTRITLFETDVAGSDSANTGAFTSASQILVTQDIQDDHDWRADDNFPAHDGRSADRGDDSQDDRTHRATVDGTIKLNYNVERLMLDHTVSVCQRAPESRRVVRVNVTIFQDPVTGAGLVNTAYALAQLQRANIAWSPACLRFQLGSMRTIAAPTTGPLSINIFADGWLDVSADTNAVIAAHAASAAIDAVELFYTAPLSGANGVTFGPVDGITALGLKTFIFIGAGRPLLGNRTLAHELGHALSNGPDMVTPLPIFYPAQPTPGMVWNPDDQPINRYRRFTAATMADVRTDRSQAHSVPGDLSSAAPPAGAVGNYFLRLP